MENGKLNAEHIYYLNMEALSDRYGWLPSQIENEEALTLEMYKAIVTGKIKRQSESEKKLKRELR